MISFAVTHPSAFLAREIENLSIRKNESQNLIVRRSYSVLAKTVSVVVFPIFLTLELLFKRVPKLLIAINNSTKFNKRWSKIEKFALGIFFSPWGIRSPDAISGFFLKNRISSSEVRPFGVERLFGRLTENVHYPSTVEELQSLVRQAKSEGKQISVIGAGMSQGTQTIPLARPHVVINTKNLRQISLSPNQETVTVGAGATWEQLQLEVNQYGKSAIVKQASDIFSIGGSIGINCHGWAHEQGAISSTVESLEVIDADGELRTLTPSDELFKCMFGTLGYFGIVVKATLKLVDNELLVQKGREIGIDEFIPAYKGEIKGKDIPLFGARLSLDSVYGNPLRKVCMVRYEKIENPVCGPSFPTKNFTAEAKLGNRIERISLKVLSHLSYFTTSRLTSWFWQKERKSMLAERVITRNEALHPPINAFKMLQRSHLHTQWLQEYFIKEENLPEFLRFLGTKLKDNSVRLINATIRPVPKDNVSILPYAEQDRYAVVICFNQLKTRPHVAQTKKWIEEVNEFLIARGDVYYQAYMPYATKEQFEQAYGKERVAQMRELKRKYDPSHLFGNAHTAKYFDESAV